MSALAGFAEAVGNTPLIRMSRLSELTGCEILGKAEFLNPGGSVKDRTAWSIVRDGLWTGGLADRSLLDASSGNTAIAYAMIGAALGFPVVSILEPSAEMTWTVVWMGLASLSAVQAAVNAAVMRAREDMGTVALVYTAHKFLLLLLVSRDAFA